MRTNKMLIVAVVIASSIVLSSAQPTANSDSQCNATWAGVPQSCRDAAIARSMGLATPDQTMMTCNSGQMCYNFLQNVIRDCGETVSNRIQLGMSTYIRIAKYSYNVRIWLYLCVAIL